MTSNFQPEPADPLEARLEAVELALQRLSLDVLTLESEVAALRADARTTHEVLEDQVGSHPGVRPRGVK